MVELVPAVCPKCGANLELPADLKIGHCMYCGAKVIIEEKKPDIHYYGIGTLENYLKLGKRSYESAIKLEKAGLIREKTMHFTILTLLVFGFGIIGFIWHPGFGIFTLCLFGVLAYFLWQKKDDFIEKGMDGLVWIGTKEFWEDIKDARKYYQKAIEIDADNKEVLEGLDNTKKLKSKYRKLEHFDKDIVVVQQPSSRCFIATATYGTPMAKEVKILRNWRDESLMKKRVGRAIVKVYYGISPPIALFVSRSDSRREKIRKILNPIVRHLEKQT